MSWVSAFCLPQLLRRMLVPEQLELDFPLPDTEVHGMYESMPLSADFFGDVLDDGHRFASM